MKKQTEAIDLKSYVQNLKLMIEKTRFLEFRKSIYDSIFQKTDLRGASSAEVHRAVALEMTKDSDLGDVKFNELLKDFVVADLTGFGPFHFLFLFSNWIYGTYSKESSELVIRFDSSEEQKIQIESFEFPPRELKQALTSMNCRLDDKMPVVSKSWDKYYFAIALPPVSTNGWLRIYNKEAMKAEWPNWQL